MLAEYYQKSLTENQLCMYAEDLSRFEAEEIKLAMYEYRNDPKNRFFPIPAQLIEILEPEVDSSLDAVEVSGRIWQAIGNCGWPNPQGARSLVGEIGWYVVERMGGWKSLCDTATESEGGILRAQIRELAKSAIERSKIGYLHRVPVFPKQNKGPELIGDIMKKLSDKSEEKNG